MRWAVASESTCLGPSPTAIGRTGCLARSKPWTKTRRRSSVSRASHEKRVVKVVDEMDPTTSNRLRSLPIGSEHVEGGVHLRVWAPKCKKVEVVIEGADPFSFALESEPGGYFSAL